MDAARPSAEDAHHVLLCLHEVRLNETIDNGQKFRLQDECFARRTGGEVTWLSRGEFCRRKTPLRLPPLVPTPRRLRRQLADAERAEAQAQPLLPVRSRPPCCCQDSGHAQSLTCA